jgi:hypothetical protein
MLSVNPALTPQDLITRLKATARPHVRVPSLFDVVDNVTTTLQDTGSVVGGVTTIGTSNCTTLTCGAGLLDASAAVLAALNPAVNITAPSSAGFGLAVSLDGSSSAAATGSSIASYLWTQTAGAAATLQNANSSTASVVMPSIAGDVTFQLQITDSLARSSSKTITISARVVALPTVVMTVSGSTLPGGTVGLNGSASYADTGFSLTNWSWQQLSGPTVSIQNPTSPNASFVSPTTPGSFTFRLTVTDNAARTSFSDVAVTTSVPAKSGGGGGGATLWLWGLGLWLLLGVQCLAAVVSRRASRAI